jgi:hypothetical protein
MHFCNIKRTPSKPEFKLYNSPIKIVLETKFLGLTFLPQNWITDVSLRFNWTPPNFLGSGSMSWSFTLRIVDPTGKQSFGMGF